MSGFLVGLNINDVAAETFSGNASTTAFTLAVAGTTNTCGVYILGVHQVPTTDYSVSGTTLTFTAAPPSGTNNVCVVYTKPQTVGAPADATVTTAKLSGNLVTPGTLDVNGQELILDADADTSITADTDDQIDIKIGGADDFRFTANNFNVLSGSTLTVDSGATITNSGTATGFADFTAIGDGSVSAPSLANSGDTNTGIYFPAADTVGVTTGGTERFRFGSNPIPGGSKNLVQNGAMTVNQRGSVAVAADSTFAIDRYSNRLIGGGPARWTVTQDTTVPAGEGFGYSHKVDVTTIDASISTDDYHGIAHTIEAQNLQHLNFNHADASALTLTFWARTKKAGLHGGAVYNNDANRSLVFSWTAVADTWQKVTVAVPGDTSGVINNDTGSGLTIYWSFSGGKYMASDTGAWVAGAYLSVTSAVNDFDSTSNDVYITGVQLEVGSVATDFAHEDYGTTLIKCKRYYEELRDGGSGYGMFHFGMGPTGNSTSSAAGTLLFSVEKRAAPTMSATAADWSILKTTSSTSFSGGEMTCNSISFSGIHSTGAWISLSSAATGMTAGTATLVQSTGANKKMTASAEL
jgi:hypothetical protein